jgi:hypothetical protein
MSKKTKTAELMLGVDADHLDQMQHKINCLERDLAAIVPDTDDSRKYLIIKGAYAAIDLAMDTTQEGLCGGPAVAEA